MAWSRLLSPSTHQHGGRDEVTTSQRRPRTIASLVMLNSLGTRPKKSLELGGQGVALLPPRERAPK